MKEILVTFKDDQQVIEGIIVDSDINYTKIKDSDGIIHKVDSDLVKLKKVDVDTEYAAEWLDTLSDHYQAADVTDVVRAEIDLVVDYIKKYLPVSKKGTNYDVETATNVLNGLINSTYNEEEKNVLSNVQKTLDVQNQMIEELKKEIEDIKESPIVAPTPLGNISAYRSSDPSYPGIFIEVDSSYNYEGNFKNATLVEYQYDTNQISVHAWEQDKEDPFVTFRWDKNPLTKIFGSETE